MKGGIDIENAATECIDRETLPPLSFNISSILDNGKTKTKYNNINNKFNKIRQVRCNFGYRDNNRSYFTIFISDT